MPTFDFKSPDGKTYSIQGPDGATSAQAFQMLQQHLASDQPAKPQGFMANAVDAVKGIPRNLLAGVMDAATSGAQAEAHGMSQPDLAAEIPNTEQAIKAVEPVTGKLYEPQGTAGKIVGSGARMLTNPASYVGPGGLPLKVGGAILSGMGSEAGGQAAEGTQYESAARVAGALLGGSAAGKAFGPTTPKAEIPTYPELKQSYKQGYKNAVESGVELKPDALGQFSTAATNHISTDPALSFTQRSAPETFAVLDDMRNPPSASGATATITASNINQIKRDLNTIAGKTQPTQTPGVFKATPDAAAAAVVREKFNNYLENLPQDHIMAGDPEAYRLAIQQANGDFGASERLRAAVSRIDTAKENAAGQIAGSVDQQLRGQMRGLLKSGASRSYAPDERAAVQSVNRGSFGSNILSQLGRGGAGVVPLAAQAAIGVPAAFATGGASIAPQAAVAAALYAARKGGEVLTTNRAKNLTEALAKRSPLYQSRVDALPAPDLQSNRAAVARALLAIR